MAPSCSYLRSRLARTLQSSERTTMAELYLGPEQPGAAYMGVATTLTLPRRLETRGHPQV